MSHSLAIGMIGVSFVLAQIVFWKAVLGGQLAKEPIVSSVAGLPFREFDSWLRVGVLADPLTIVMLFMVTLIFWLQPKHR